MKRMMLATATLFVLTAGAALAQSPLNTTAPGPTQQQEPGETNNNLPNPGHPVPTPQGTATAPVTENGTVEGTATESIQQDQGTTTGTMDNTTGTMDNTTGSTSGGSMDTTTGSATGSTNDSYSTSTGTTTSGSMDNNTDTSVSGTSGSLPATGSEMPLVGLIGLSALAAAAALHASRRA